MTIPMIRSNIMEAITRANMIALFPFPSGLVATVSLLVLSSVDSCVIVVSGGVDSDVVSSLVVCSGICSPTNTKRPLFALVKEILSPSATGVYIPSSASKIRNDAYSDDGNE